MAKKNETTKQQHDTQDEKRHPRLTAWLFESGTFRAFVDLRGDYQVPQEHWDEFMKGIGYQSVTQLGGGEWSTCSVRIYERLQEYADQPSSMPLYLLDVSMGERGWPIYVESFPDLLALLAWLSPMVTAGILTDLWESYHQELDVLMRPAHEAVLREWREGHPRMEP